MMRGYLLRAIAAGAVSTALFAAPGLPIPGAERSGFGGEAQAQGYVGVDYFYDELAPFGQWVWHPRFGYVWLPETVSPYWRPYTVGRWISTDEYGWYWDSHEPFAWAVYHYGRWGYDPDYGWFWVPGDVWAPAWVQWRYSDAYVGWAPIGPGRQGYAYGTPVSYDPSIAEAWVFVQPRFLTSRAISHYALPIGALGPAFFSATTIYRPEFRRGVVYNYGIPRDRVVKITRRPIVVDKVYRFDRKDRWQRDTVKGVKIYAPGFARSDRPHRPPKRFVDHPNEFRPKARLKEVYKGDLPKGWGRSAKGMVPIAKEAGPEAWKKKHVDFDRGDGDGRDRDKGKDRDKNKVQFGDPNAPGFKQGQPEQRRAKQQFGKSDDPGGFDQPKQPKQFDQSDQGNEGRKNKNKQQFGDPNAPGFNQGQPDHRRTKQQFGTQEAPSGVDDPRQAKQFDQFDEGKDGRKNKNKQQFGGPGGPGGPPKQGGDQRGQGAGDGGGKNKKKQAKCEKNPDHPGCQ